MDDYSFPSSGDCTYAPACFAPDPITESYNYCMSDPVALMIRHQREEEERNRSHAERDEAWAPSAAPPYETSADWDSRPATTTRPSQSPDDYDDWADSPAHRALAAGEKYYHLPGEPKTWRRPLSTPSGKYDAQWWRMFINADELSMYLAEQLGYIGARDVDGWIRPTHWELLRMDFWSVQRYAFYYAEFAREFGRKIPRWIEILRPLRAHVPVGEI